MPLSPVEKNQIAQGGIAAGSVATALLAGVGLLGSTGIGLAFVPLALGVSRLFGRIRFPRLSPADIGRAAAASIRGSVISTDPFFGDIVISHPDQARFLTELVRNAAIRRLAAEQDTSRIFLQRRALAEGLEATAEERGFAPAVDPSLRGGVFRATADDPLQFIEGNFLL